jgi:hypothetical protein
MKSILAAAIAMVVLSGAPALAQSVTDALSTAAKQAATQAATDGLNKAVGTKDDADRDRGDKGKHANKSRDDRDPNWGKSESHRQDDEHGHKGKKNKNRY